MGMMDNSEERETRGPSSSMGFCKSRTFMVLAGFLAVAGLFLAYEHRVHIFTGSGLLILILLLCPAMHLFMHGGHGGHGGHGPHRDHGDRIDRE